MKDKELNKSRLTDLQREIGVKEVAEKYDTIAKDKSQLKKSVKGIFNEPKDVFGEGMLSSAINGLNIFASKMIRKTLEYCVKEKIIESKLADVGEFVYESITGLDVEVNNIEDLRKIILNQTEHDLDRGIIDVVEGLKPRHLDILISNVASLLNIGGGNLGSIADVLGGVPYMLVKFGLPIATQLLGKLLDSVVDDVLLAVGFTDEEKVASNKRDLEALSKDAAVIEEVVSEIPNASVEIVTDTVETTKDELPAMDIRRIEKTVFTTKVEVTENPSELPQDTPADLEAPGSII